MKCMKCFNIDKCFFCKKYKFYLYEIPIYNDFHHLYCSITQETYITCWKCIIKLIQKKNINISFKSIVKDSIIQNMLKEDLSVNSKKNMKELQTALINEREFHDYTDFLTSEEIQKIKEIKNKIELNYMC